MFWSFQVKGKTFIIFKEYLITGNLILITSGK